MAANEVLKNLPFYYITDAELGNLFGEKIGSGRLDVFENNEFYNYLVSVSKAEALQNLSFNYSSVTEFDSACINITNQIALSIFHLNIHSLNKNNQELYQFIQSMTLDFDVIVLSEIWSYNIELYPNLFVDYTLYYDLPVSSSVGGVAIYVKNTLNQHEAVALKIDSTDDCRIENIWLEISKGSQQYLIGGTYRHPGQDIDKFTAKIEKILLQLKKLNSDCFIAGDINIDFVKYDSHSATSNYVENLLMYNFIPTITMPTRITPKTATLIDHIYFSPGSKYNPQFAIQSGNIWCDITDHLPNYCLLLDTNTKQKEERPFVRLFSRTNIEKFKEKIRNTDWNEIYDCSNVNLAFQKFEENIKCCFETSFKLVRLSRRRAKDKKWMTAGLLASSKTKNRLYKKWLKSQSPLDEQKYKSYRQVFKCLVTAAETSYCKEQFDTRTNTTKQLWSNMNSMFSFKRKKSQTAIGSLNIGNKIVRNVTDICNGLNNYYCNVGDKLVQSLVRTEPNDFTQYCSLPNLQSMFFNPVDSNDIEKIIMSFKNNKSPGVDNIGPKILKEVCPEIAIPLEYLFNLSFSTGVVPDSLKLAKVIIIDFPNLGLTYNGGWCSATKTR